MAKKVLIVEDEIDHVLMAQTRIEALGYEVDSAGDGEEGLRKAQEGKPDLVLLDLIMPKMDGRDVCKQLKADPATKGIKILIFSALGTVNIERECADCGADDFIKKPYEAPDLMGKIEKLLKP